MSWRDPLNQLQASEKHTPQTFLQTSSHPLAAMPAATLGMVSNRARTQMVQRLQSSGQYQAAVLSAMTVIDRHAFVDTALASRAYEDTVLPIGFKQTISQPSVVASMVSLACEAQYTNGVWLEIGTGCGYQAAIMAQCTQYVCSIERIEGLYQQANQALFSRALKAKNITICLGDGTVAWRMQNHHTPGRLSDIQANASSGSALVYERFDAIVVAAAGLGVAPSWLQQLNIGGHLITPLQDADGVQRLHKIIRHSELDFEQHTLQAVQFVPLLAGMTYC
jgi:protein-L-isoaspartate(D-aspartate) O-methyltransferase